MKNLCCYSHLFTVKNFMLLSVILLLGSCNKWVVPEAYIGQWETNKQEIVVRTKEKSQPFVFTGGYADVSITINADKTVSGRIGSAHFSNARLDKNYGLPFQKVVSPVYIVKCGSIGKIFATDPLNQKEVEIWFAPINENGISNSELRYTQNGAQFPMADLMFIKVKK